MPLYTLSFLLPNLADQEKKKVEEEIETKIKTLEGKIKDKYFERKSFAYPVKKHEKGIFGEIVFSLEKEKLLKLQDFLKFHSQILRTVLERKKEIALPKKKVPPFAKKKKVKIEELEEKLKELLK